MYLKTILSGQSYFGKIILFFFCQILNISFRYLKIKTYTTEYVYILAIKYIA